MRRDEHDVAGPQVGDDRVVPVRQHPGDDVGEALGARDDIAREEGVALVH